ncbi:hypothetical protein HK096_000379, partial [Nowakowskiella sp. JEL0078]
MSKMFNNSFFGDLNVSIPTSFDDEDFGENSRIDELMDRKWEIDEEEPVDYDNLNNITFADDMPLR